MRLSQIGVFTAILCPTYAFAVATISLKAVAKNGVAIPPTNQLNISPNDMITAEVLLSGWNNPPFDGQSGIVSFYQVTLLGKEGVRSSGNCPGQCNSNYILPLGWDAPLEKDPCPCEDPCYPICNDYYGCVGPNFHPEHMASIDRTRQDFIFRGIDSICDVDVSSPDIQWGCVTIGNEGRTASRCQGGSNAGLSCLTNAECPGGTCNANFLSYLGTLNLKVGSSVCGTFTFTISMDPTETFIGPPFPGIPILPVPAIQGLTLIAATCPQSVGACCNESTGVCMDHVTQQQCAGRWGGPCSTCATMDPPCVAEPGACCFIGNCGYMECDDSVHQQDCSGFWAGPGSTCATTTLCPLGPPIIDTLPPNCTIDARRPSSPNHPEQRDGVITVFWPFYSALGKNEDSPDDFTVRQVPSNTPPIAPTITSVIWNQPNHRVTLHFSEPIHPNKWTCVKHSASGCEKCFGYLPGDANNNRTAVASDILAIIDNLNGLVNPPLQAYQCDIDRSGACAPADILTEIDLLNGVTGFPAQNGRSLEPCPTP